MFNGIPYFIPLAASDLCYVPVESTKPIRPTKGGGYPGKRFSKIRFWEYVVLFALLFGGILWYFELFESFGAFLIKELTLGVVLGGLALFGNYFLLNWFTTIY